MNGGRPVRALLALLVLWTILREAEAAEFTAYYDEQLKLVTDRLATVGARWVHLGNASAILGTRAPQQAEARIPAHHHDVVRRDREAPVDGLSLRDVRDAVPRPVGVELAGGAST